MFSSKQIKTYLSKFNRVYTIVYAKMLSTYSNSALTATCAAHEVQYTRTLLLILLGWVLYFTRVQDSGTVYERVVVSTLMLITHFH